MSSHRHKNWELERLSAYLDHELNRSEQHKIEALLERDPDLQNQLEKLRKTKVMVAHLPRLRAPHNFTLTPEMVTVRPQRKPRLVSALRFATAFAAIMLVVLMGVDFVLQRGPLASPEMAAEPVMKSAPIADAGSPEPLIVWGEPGTGGGGEEGVTNGMGGGVLIEQQTNIAVESLPIEPESTDSEEAIEAEEPVPPRETESYAAIEEEAEAPLIRSEESKEIPILGINPDAGGDIISSSEPTPEPSPTIFSQLGVIRLIQIGLGVIAIGGVITLLILRLRRAG